MLAQADKGPDCTEATQNHKAIDSYRNFKKISNFIRAYMCAYIIYCIILFLLDGKNKQLF